MSFENREESQYHGEPIELYFFKYGPAPTDYYAYTDSEEPVTFDGIVYVPKTIDRDPIKAQGTLDKATIEIRASTDLEVAELFRVYPPSYSVTLVIRTNHLEDTDFLVIWSGRIISSARKGNENIYVCEPVSTSMRRPGLRRHYQFGCPHVVYGPSCNANQAAATVTTTVESIVGTVITLPADWPGLAQGAKYVGGIVTWEADGRTEIKTILRVTDSRVLLLSGFARGLTAAMSINVVLGCNKTRSDCETIHNNIQNFGGFPYIPTNNPIGNATIFY